MADERARGDRARYLGIGCMTAVAGLFSGGMIAVLVAKFVGSATGCEPPTGLPACDWHKYAAGGMFIGMFSLPLLSIRRLRRHDAAGGSSERG